jgi:hypothetical protein
MSIWSVVKGAPWTPTAAQQKKKRQEMAPAFLNSKILPSSVIKHGRLEIPELNGGFNANIIYKWWIFYCHV